MDHPRTALQKDLLDHLEEEHQPNAASIDMFNRPTLQGGHAISSHSISDWSTMQISSYQLPTCLLT